MNKQEISDRLKAIVSEHLNIAPDRVTPEAKFLDDLGADSLDVVELLMAAEEEFHVEISDEDGEFIITFDDAVNHVAKLVGA